MGTAVGERVVRAHDRARDLRLPVVVATRSGGARLQEGMVALAQLARTASAASRHARAGAVARGLRFAHDRRGLRPTPRSSTCARGRARRDRVRRAPGGRGALGEPLPPGSHTAEAAYDEGQVDALLPASAMSGWIDAALGLTAQPLPTRPLPVVGPWGGRRLGGGPAGAGRRPPDRHRPRRPPVLVVVRAAGPRSGGAAGLATVAGGRCVVVATDRYHGNGRPTPAGFRLAQRAVRLAGRLGLPVVTLVDTPGADPSPASEADGMAGEIARTLQALAECPTPVVSVCVGEGGSGGALALSYADRLLMTEHAVFSVIGPEGAAAILERDPTRAPKVAVLGLTSADLLRLGVVDEVVPEGQDALDAAVAEPSTRRSSASASHASTA